MKKRIALYLTLCLLLIVSVVALIPASAQDNTPTPDPNNACNPGGAMAGKCNSGFHADGKISPAEIEWAWKCGWYMARYYEGTITRDQVPDECSSLLPGLPQQPAMEVTAEATETATPPPK